MTVQPRTQEQHETAAPEETYERFEPQPVEDPYPWGNLATFRSAAEGLTDAIKARISTENRVKRGGGAVDATQAAVMVRIARDQEEAYRRILLDIYQQMVPQHIQDWAKSIPGIASGELFPRILGVLGHPRIAIPYQWEDKELVPAGEPFERSLRQLWQYAGCGDPETNPRSDILGHSPTRDDKLRGGKRTTLRPLLFTFSSYLVRAHTRSEAVAGSRFYQVYTAAREEGAEKRHYRQCQNRKRPPMAPNGCGTVAHPEWGEPGSVWRPGHANAHAHRMVAKEFLRELWIISGA